MSHIIAESVSELCWIHPRIYPSSNSICDPESYIRAFPNSANEEGVLSTGWTGFLIFPPRFDVVIGVEVEDVPFGVVAAVFRGK
jgi:hypothetical protein